MKVGWKMNDLSIAEPEGTKLKEKKSRKYCLSSGSKVQEINKY